MSRIKNLKQNLKHCFAAQFWTLASLRNVKNSFGGVLFLVGGLQLYKLNTSLQLFLMKRLKFQVRETSHIQSLKRNIDKKVFIKLDNFNHINTLIWSSVSSSNAVLYPSGVLLYQVISSRCHAR